MVSSVDHGYVNLEEYPLGDAFGPGYITEGGYYGGISYCEVS